MEERGDQGGRCLPFRLGAHCDSPRVLCIAMKIGADAKNLSAPAGLAELYDEVEQQRLVSTKRSWSNHLLRPIRRPVHGTTDGALCMLSAAVTLFRPRASRSSWPWCCAAIQSGSLTMPYLQLDVPRSYPHETERRSARRIGELYGQIVHTTVDGVSVGFRELSEGSLWACGEGSPGPGAVLMCNILEPIEQPRRHTDPVQQYTSVRMKAPVTLRPQAAARQHRTRPR